MNEMDVKIIAISTPFKNSNVNFDFNILKSPTKENLQNLKEEWMIMSGKYAGICYTKDDFSSLENEPNDASKKRANFCLMQGHHSVFDHIFITFEFINFPKMLAMTLNNEKMYTTSEKSARYTIMNLAKKEQNIYDKWLKIIHDKLNKDYPLEQYPKLLEGKRNTVAQENARYFTSVFTPCHLIHTVSIRQLNYEIEMIKEYIDTCIKTKFSKKFIQYLQQFISNDIIQCLTIEGLSCKEKSRKLSIFENPLFTKDIFDSVYQTKYQLSFAAFAQNQRHRTISYSFDFPTEFSFYIPELIQDSKDLVSEWKNDMLSVKDNFPQGQLVNVYEKGTVENFVLKCKERICFNAQLEVMRQSVKTLKEYISKTKNTNEQVYNYLVNSTNNATSRCKFKDFKCNKPCIFGSKQYERKF